VVKNTTSEIGDAPREVHVNCASTSSASIPDGATFATSELNKVAAPSEERSSLVSKDIKASSAGSFDSLEVPCGPSGSVAPKYAVEVFESRPNVVAPASCLKGSTTKLGERSVVRRVKFNVEVDVHVVRRKN